MLPVMFTAPFHVPRQGMLVKNCHHGVVGTCRVPALQPSFPELQVHLILMTVWDAHKLHGSSHGWPSHAA